MGVAELKSRFQFHPVVDISIPEWADQYRRLPASSAVSGKWRTAAVEIFRGPMVAFDDPAMKLLTICSAVQLGKSEVLLNIIGRTAHFDPAPILLVQPKEAAATKFSRERLAPMISGSPELRTKFDLRTRYGDSIDYKPYVGGAIFIEGAASPMNLASRACRITLLDEVDKYELTKEGHPIHLAEARTATYGDRAKHVRVCSPTQPETSAIWQSYLDSDQRKAWITCPNCDVLFQPTFFGNVEWPTTESGEHRPNDAAIWCPTCGTALTEDQRRKIVTTARAIVWRQGRPFSCCGEEGVVPSLWDYDEANQVGIAKCPTCGSNPVARHHAGYQVSQIFSPFTTIATLAREWLAAKDDPGDKATWRNTRLGEPASSEQIVENVQVAQLLARREQFPDYCPAEVAGLFCGCDVQTGSDLKDGSLHPFIWGFSPDRQMWSVYHEIIEGDIRLPRVWEQLDRLLLSKFPHACGKAIVVQACCIDAGDGRVADLIANWCAARKGRNVWAIKGASEKSSISWSEIWPGPSAKKTQIGGTTAKMKVVGSNAAKWSIYSRLPLKPGESGSIHFDTTWDENLFAQFTAETLLTVRRGGFTTRKFVQKKGRANEALDSSAYALCALEGWLRQGGSLERSAQILKSFMGPKS